MAGMLQSAEEDVPEPAARIFRFMLRELQISNFAIIDHLSLSFAPGLNILTGETGAGKSIIVDALELLFGGRGSIDLIRSGSDQAIVELVLDPPLPKSVSALLAESGLASDGEDELILRRMISRSGKGRIYINGHPATVSLLQAIGRGLVDIHGQHDHQSLLDSNWQLILLDGYGQLTEQRERYSRSYQEWRAVADELQALSRSQQDLEQRVDFLKFQIGEIRAVDPQPDEDRSLERERNLLSNSGRLRENAEAAYHLIYEAEDSVLSLLDRAGQHLEIIRGIDQGFDESLPGWGEVQAELKDSAAVLRRYKDGIDHDPARQDAIEERLFQIGRLKKKYGASVEEILLRLEQMEEELSSLENHEERLIELRRMLDQKEAETRAQGRQLSQLRTRAASRFKAEIEKQFRQLGMERMAFEVCMECLPGHLSSRGMDRVEFMIASGPGEVAKPLSRTASGGELSRIMLAIKTVLADVDQIPILIFDEVDAGVGGAVAEAVGRRLKSIARRRQVFCITHLHQIAMLADGHYRVEKISQKGRFLARTHRLDRDERVREIARMMGGREITALTLQHAQELLSKSGAAS